MINPYDPNRGQPGQDLLWPGEFVLGYPRQQGTQPPAEPLPGSPEYASNSTVPAASTSGVPVDRGPDTFAEPAWAADGSYLVFRRLAQDAASFERFVNKIAPNQNKSAALVGATLVGRDQADDGHDAIIAQRPAQRDLAVPGSYPSALSGIAQFVATTRGDYFFPPSVSAVTLLSSPGGLAGSARER